MPPRQAALIQQIQDAEQQGNAQLKTVLCSQLVHRFGVDALNTLDRVIDDVEEAAGLAPPESAEEAPSQAAGLFERFSATLRVRPEPADTASRPRRDGTPPLSTPRSLRRWLPGSQSDLDRQAS